MSTTTQDLGPGLVPHEKPSLKRKHSTAMSPATKDKKPKLVRDEPPPEKEFEGFSIGGWEASDYACRSNWRVGLFKTAYRKEGGKLWTFFIDDITFYALLILGQYCWVTRPISTFLIMWDLGMVLFYDYVSFILLVGGFALGLAIYVLGKLVRGVIGDREIFSMMEELRHNFEQLGDWWEELEERVEQALAQAREAEAAENEAQVVADEAGEDLTTPHHEEGEEVEEGGQ